jgi:hypothetical protein
MSRNYELYLRDILSPLYQNRCPLPPGTHAVVYCRDSGGDEQDRSVAQQIVVGTGSPWITTRNGGVSVK